MEMEDYKLSQLYGMEVKKMKLSNYSVSYWDSSIKKRHVAKINENIVNYIDLDKQKVLCGLMLYNRSQYFNKFLYKRKFNYKKEICPTCFSLLPENLQEELKFNYIVSKLKNED